MFLNLQIRNLPSISPDYTNSVPLHSPHRWCFLSCKYDQRSFLQHLSALCFLLSLW